MYYKIKEEKRMFTLIFWSIIILLLIVLLHIVGCILCIAYIWEWIALMHSEIKEEQERKKARKERAKLAKNNPDFVFFEI